MKTLEFSRSQFIGWLAERDRVLAAQLPPDTQYARGEIALIWLNEDEGEDPIVAVKASEMRDFLAFVATYVGTYVPFTSFFRVIAKELIPELPALHTRLDRTRLDALIGVVLCDAAMSQLPNPASRVSDISLQSCLATPSYAALQAIGVGYSNEILQAILTRWFSVRSELQQGPLRTKPEQLTLFWTTVLAAFESRPYSFAGMQEGSVIEFIAAVREGGGVATDRDWASLGSVISGVQSLSTGLAANREDKVRLLDSFAATLGPSSSKLVHGMVLGYLASQLADGSMTYLGVASRFLDQFPLSVLWFGLFSGLKPNNDILVAGECLGRRVKRTLVSRQRSGTVQADFAYEEFVLLLQEGRIGRVRTDSTSVVEVELMPWVSGRFKISRGNTRPQDEHHKLNIAVDAVRRVVGQLQGTLRELETEPRADARELFDNREVKPSNKKPYPKRKPYR